MAEDMGEKTEDPTARRKNEARQKGNVARSQDLGSAIIMTGVVLVLAIFGARLLTGLGSIMHGVLGVEFTTTDPRGGRIGQDIALISAEVVGLVLPILLIMAAIAYASQFVQVGWLISAESLKFKPDKLNPISGAKKLFSKRSLVKAGLDILKFVFISAVAFVVIGLNWGRVLGLASLPLRAGLAEAAELLLITALWILVALLILGLLDLAYQRWQHKQDLKMTKHEVKDERRSTEGDMETRGRRLKMAREQMMQRVQRDVPGADVVVANPTHYAVALKYDADTMHAPRVVAKGADYLALKIRYVAAANGVPIVERPPLARALYRSVEVGQEVDAAHYEAVAEVLAYVYRLEEAAAAS